MLTVQNAQHQLLFADSDALLVLIAQLPRIELHRSGDLSCDDRQYVARSQQFPVKLIHLVDKYEERHLIMLQELDQDTHLRVKHLLVDNIGRTHDEHRVVKDSERALHLGRKVHVPRGIQKRHVLFSGREPCHFGENSYPSFFLQGFRVQEGILVVHPSQRADHSCLKEDALCQCSFSRIHVREDADRYICCH